MIMTEKTERARGGGEVREEAAGAAGEDGAGVSGGAKQEEREGECGE